MEGSREICDAATLSKNQDYSKNNVAVFSADVETEM
jgi:hypothetical protein